MSEKEAEIHAFYQTFSRELSAGNLDALIALYEPGASLVHSAQNTSSGVQVIREMLEIYAGVDLKITSHAFSITITGDIALTIRQWTSQSLDSMGNKRESEGIATDVLRKQSDGRWLFVIDNPSGITLLSPSL